MPFFNDLTKETNLRRSGCGLNTSIRRRTVKREAQNSTISFEKGQTTTEARARENRDIRNMVSVAAANYAFAKDNPPNLIANFNATLFEISE